MHLHRFVPIVVSLSFAVVLASKNDPSYAQCEVRETHKLLASIGGAQDNFGYSVSMSGNTFVVGAPSHDYAMGNDCGSAYVFRWNGVNWFQEAELTPSDLAPMDRFGDDIAMDGDRIVIGAAGSDPNGLMLAGAAYVFRREGTIWVQEAKLTLPDAAQYDRFGSSVAMSTDRIFVGAPNKPSELGSVYVYRRQGTAWVQEALLFPPGNCMPGSLNYFGSPLSANGDRVLVGADFPCGSNVASPEGAAYMFRRQGTTWVQEAPFPRPPDAVFLFGTSVSLSDDVALVGYLQGDHSNFAAVFRRVGNAWSIEKTFGPVGGNTGFMQAAINGDAAVVGTWWQASAGISGAGVAHVFLRNGTDWQEVAQLTASDAASGDGLGFAVSMEGYRVVLGAFRDDNLGGIDAGAAYIYDLPHDCNANGVEDGCETASDPSLDLDGNGYPDECCVLRSPVAGPGAVAKNRYFALMPGNPGALTALRVTLSSLHHPDPPNLTGTASFAEFEGGVRWVGPPADCTESTSDGTIFKTAPLQCAPHYMDWSTVGLLHVYGSEVLPSSAYDVEAIMMGCSPSVEANDPAPLSITTARWGDVAPPYQQTCALSGCSPCTAENCVSQPDALDITALVNKFKSLAGSPSKVEAQLQPNVPDPHNNLNALDVASCVDAFKRFPYAYGGPAACQP